MIFEKTRGRINTEIIKYAFFKKDLQYLGNLISGERVYPLKETIASLVQVAPAADVTETRHITGLASSFCLEPIMPS